MLRFVAAIVPIVGLAFGATSAQPLGTRDLPVRVEIYPIPTVTLTDQQFLIGDRSGKPVTISGELSIPQGTGRLPLVVLMHGSGGAGGNIQYWKRVLNGMGIATFVVDSLTGRGLTGVGDNQALLGRLNYLYDIFQALPLMAKHPRLDPDRIVLMGFSRGGQATLYASNKRFQKLWNQSGVEFAAYI